MPRPNGYQSLHTSVVSDRGLPFEVQIRTIDMHRIAEEGIAAHWKYKEGRVGTKPDEQYFRWLRQLIEWQQEIRDPQEFIQHLKIDLYPEEVYCFTPRGEVKALPRGRHADRLRLRDSHRRRPPVRRRPRQRHDGAAADAPEERRHRRDHDAARAQAEPRLARLRHHVTGAAEDPALHPRRGEDALARARQAHLRQGGAPFRRVVEAAHRRGPAEGGARARAAADRRSASPRSATARSRPGRCCRRSSASTSCARSRPRPASPRWSSGCSGPGRTASRSRGSTISWWSAPAAATRSAARRSSATSAAARACRCTRRRARTWST